MIEGLVFTRKAFAELDCRACMVGPVMGHRAIEWTFGGTWPYTPRWFDTGDGRMHYIDEGPQMGRPVVMLHGNPTWGYLYRNFIPPLIKAGFRAIVPDHLGFGRSEKPDDPDWRH